MAERVGKSGRLTKRGDFASLAVDPAVQLFLAHGVDQGAAVLPVAVGLRGDVHHPGRKQASVISLGPLQFNRQQSSRIEAAVDDETDAGRR